MKKIQLIESPEEALLSQEEMEEILAGWTCGSYNHSLCNRFSDTATCGGGGNYCDIYCSSY